MNIEEGIRGHLLVELDKPKATEFAFVGLHNHGIDDVSVLERASELTSLSPSTRLVYLSEVFVQIVFVDGSFSNAADEQFLRTQG